MLVLRVRKYLHGREVTKQENMKVVTELVTDIPYHETNRKDNATSRSVRVTIVAVEKQ